MPRMLVASLVLAGALASVACTNDYRRIETEIREFQASLDEGRLPEIQRLYPSVIDGSEHRLRSRIDLGPVQRSTRASYQDVGWPGSNDRLVTVFYNSEFRNGRALEKFVFRLNDDGARLTSYSFQAGQVMRCDCFIFTMCEISAAPARQTRTAW